jgi:CRP-like cAMP-binding protein
MEQVSGNIFLRKHALNAGDVIDGHKHNFDHTSIVFSGAVRVVARTPDGRDIVQEFQAPAHFLVRAEVTHEITALVPTEFWCVYAHRDPQGRITQEVTGWLPAYQ